MLTGKSSVDVRRICKSERKFFFFLDDNNIIEVKFIMEDFIRVVKKKKLVT